MVLPSDLSTNIPSLVDVTGGTQLVGYGFNIDTTNTGEGLALTSYTPVSVIYVARSGPGGYLNRISLASGQTPTPARLSNFQTVETDGVCAEADIYGTIFDPTTEFVIVGEDSGSTDPQGCSKTSAFSLVTSPSNIALTTSTVLPTTIDWTQPVVPLYNGLGVLTGVLAFATDTMGGDLTFYPSNPPGSPPSFSASTSTLLVSQVGSNGYLRIDTSREGVLNPDGSVVFFQLSAPTGYQLWRIGIPNLTLTSTLIHSYGLDFTQGDASDLPVRDDANVYFGDQSSPAPSQRQTAWYSAPIAGGSGATLLYTTLAYSSAGVNYALVDSDGSNLIFTSSDYVTPVYSLLSIPVTGGSVQTLLKYPDANTGGIQAYLDYPSKNIFITHQTLNLSMPYTAPDSLVIKAPSATQMNATPASRYLAFGNSLLTTQPAILQLTGLTGASGPGSDQGASVVSVNTMTLVGTAVTGPGGSPPYVLPACPLDMFATPIASGFYAGYLTPHVGCDNNNQVGVLIDMTKNQGVMSPTTDSITLY